MFVYPQMTPALSEYLTLSKQHPNYKYKTPSTGTPTEESVAAVKAWQNLLTSLKANLPEGLLEDYYQKQLEWLCRDETSGVVVSHTSPSGKYRLDVTRHNTGGTTWEISKGRVYWGELLIATVCRNYPAFPFAWIEDHPNGDFLVCGKSYMSYSLVDLISGQTTHNPEKGFCWSSIHPSPDKSMLAVTGCYWGGEYEVRIFDFSNPRTFPYPLLKSSSLDTFLGWNADSSCQVGVTYTVVDLPGYHLDGKKEWDCTSGEFDEVDRIAKERGLTGFDPGWKDISEIQLVWTRE